MKIRNTTQRKLGLIWGLAYLSGTALFVLSRFVRLAGLSGEEHHPWEAKLRVIHFSVTYVGLISLGYLLHSHIIPGLRSSLKRGRRSGLSLALLLLILPVSAVAMLYGGDADWVRATTWIHSVIGIGIPVLLVLHRRTKKPPSRP